MNKLVLGGMALIAFGMSAPAVAADMPVKVKAPPPVVVYDWSGAYVGFNIGGVWTEVNRNYPNFGPFGVPLDYKSTGDDVIYGFHAGAQAQWGNWVLGIEAAYSAGFREMQSTVALPAPPLPANTVAYNKITNLFTVGPRLGFAWDRWMVYGTGGWASADIKGQYQTNGVQSLANFVGQSRNDGWFAGGGLEYMVHKGALVDVIFGAEYQHFDVRSKTAFCRIPGCGIASTEDFNHDAVGDIVRARLTIKTQGYGWWGPM
jgi:outer membrane immunogenic protein